MHPCKRGVEFTTQTRNASISPEAEDGFLLISQLKRMSAEIAPGAGG